VSSYRQPDWGLPWRPVLSRSAKSALHGNQSLFRAVNVEIETVNETFGQATETVAIACECADVKCIEMLEIAPDEYLAVRAEPRHFVVLSGHLYPEVERMVRELDGYVVVEKTGTAGDVAEKLRPDDTAEIWKDISL
jgi:hypothetical protein